MAGKIPPSPSSPLSRSSTKLTALSIARRRGSAGNIGSASRNSRSSRAKAWPIAEPVGGAIQSRTLSGGSVNSSAIVTPRGLRARGRIAISTSSGTSTTRDQYDTLST
jgi:hypothetical protein